jgi:hypothetical protein
MFSLRSEQVKIAFCDGRGLAVDRIARFESIVVLLATLPLLIPGGSRAQDAKLLSALNNVQSEMSDCLAYYSNIKGCVGTQDKELSDRTQRTLDALALMAVKVGRSAGMTPDAMMSRLSMFQDEQHELIKGNCANMSSLFTRHAARCKQVVKNGDSILDEYLKR